MYKEELDETKAKLTAVSQQLKVAQDQLKEVSHISKQQLTKIS